MKQGKTGKSTVKKVPLRKCMGCGEMKGKKEMIRVVHNEAGEFFLDFTGKKAGRGAYVCKTMDCLEKAVKSKGLERSFKAAVPKDVYESLKKELEKIVNETVDMEQSL